MVNLSLAGRVALITGGSRGIGAATVKMFCQAGAQVAFNYQKARKEAEEIVKACGGEARCSAIQQELSSSSSGARPWPSISTASSDSSSMPSRK